MIVGEAVYIGSDTTIYIVLEVDEVTATCVLIEETYYGSSDYSTTLVSTADLVRVRDSQATTITSLQAQITLISDGLTLVQDEMDIQFPGWR
jgi:hypothetical protein